MNRPVQSIEFYGTQQQRPCESSSTMKSTRTKKSEHHKEEEKHHYGIHDLQYGGCPEARWPEDHAYCSFQECGLRALEA
jgi:hypothetical protein